MIPKFRAWDKKHNQMCEVLQIHFDLEFVNCINEWIRNLKFDNCILMQSTELLDKYGNEIYEGDILKTRARGLVEVRHEDGNTVVTYKSGVNTRTTLVLSSFLDKYQISIIGNIYENPELLEVEEWKN